MIVFGVIISFFTASLKSEMSPYEPISLFREFYHLFFKHKMKGFSCTLSFHTKYVKSICQFFIQPYWNVKLAASDHDVLCIHHSAGHIDDAQNCIFVSVTR